MSAPCHDGREAFMGRPDAELVIALAGNPNVGKSSLFNALTGLGVETAHYPGTTREVFTGIARAGERSVGVIDLPGSYGFTGVAEEDVVALRALEDLEPDVVVVVVDPTTLGRTLYLALEAIDLGYRVVLAVNLVDEARRSGLEVDSGALATALGIPVIPTVATQGIGVSDVVDACFRVAEGPVPEPPGYGPDFEALLEPLVSACSEAVCLPCGRSARGAALEMLSVPGGPEQERPAGIDAALRQVRSSMRSHFGESGATHLARERHGLAGLLGEEAVRRKERHWLPRDAWSLTTWPWTGVPLVVLVAAGIFGFLFFFGDLLARGFSSLWGAFASPAITSTITSLVGEGVLSRVLLWGFDAGIEASLSIGLPYILTFYFLIGFLEDTGYLNSLAFLTDRLMHRFGLHGRAIVPMVASAGCNVPALMAAGQLPSKRERVIASTLVLFVPCSARTAVILGAVGHYLGWQPTLLVLGILVAVWLGVGLSLQKMVPGTSRGLVMEMFPFRRPSVKRVAAKAWGQFKEFLFIATPIVIVGSLVLGGLYETGWLVKLSDPLAPVVEGWLGLPAIAGLTLLLGFLRKELSLQLLVALAVATAGFAGAELTELMSATDIVVFAVVNAIMLPCISTMTVYWRRNGLPTTAIALGATVVIALVVGGVLARVLPLIGMGA
ncbi:MAG: ferrous iron transport protein B [Coriobacteriia bacterium]|nr:ferrous iron transport protein B [Coriobacteriia bacterium]MBN2847564.1 ferrous iron transport protein B [Coriobacteriia bacterium]